MVSLGTIFTIAVIGAVAAGAYALSRNTQQLGAAFSRGAENLVSAPFTNYLNSLFTNLPTLTPIPKAAAQQPTAVALSQPSAGLPNPANAPTNPTPIDLGLSQGIKPTPTPSQIIADPNTSLDKFQPPVSTPSAGYYYLNYVGAASGFDRQQYLSKTEAQKWIEGINVKKQGGSLQDIRFLGTRKLSDKGFQIIGRANQYL